MLKSKFHKNVVTVLTGLAVLISMALPGAAEARVSVSDLVLQLTAVAADGPQANLQWALSDSTTISGFEVERSLDPLTGYTVVSTPGRSDRSFVDQSVVAGQAYYYKVRAYKKSTYSEYSNVVFTDIPVDVPPVPVDTSPPSVTMINPADNATFTTEQTVYLNADAIDNLGVERVDFYRNDILVGSDSSAPYTAGWTISDALNGQHSLKAKAYDKAGNEGVCVSKNVTVDIALQETPVPGSFEFSASSYTVNESAGNVNITIKRVGGSDGSASVDFRTRTFSGLGTADWASDYGTVDWTQVTFADGQSSKVVGVIIKEDAVVENNEWFTLQLQNPTGGTTLGSVVQSIVTIADNDVAIPVPGSFELSAADYSVDESAGKVNITLKRVGGSDGAASVDFRTRTGGALGTADWSTDYGTIDWMPIAFADGEASKVISVIIKEDTVVEDNEWFTLQLQNPTGGTALGSVVQSIVTITDNDIAVPVPGSFEFSATNYSVDESAGKVNVSISRVGGSDGAANVEIRTRTFSGFGTADWAVDYGTIDWTPVAFADGETNKVVNVVINDDDVAEDDETFTVQLQAPTGGANLGALASSIVTIIDNDKATEPPTVPPTDPPVISGPVKIFPGAQGFGTDSPAGRGGQVVKVTNLNDSGSGSLRAAIQMSGPRTVVFEVGGEIHLTSGELTISNPYITIAGQSAPFPGITILNGGFDIRTHDVLVQHMRMRPGDKASDSSDPIQILGSGAYNIVFDHCTASWAKDEGLVLYSGAHDVTLSNSIVSDQIDAGLNVSHGMLIGYNSKNVSIIGNLLANNRVRNPYVQENVTAILANNVIYNVGNSSFISVTYHSASPPPSYITVEGNKFINGPLTSGAVAVGGNNSISSATEIYLSDNSYTGTVNGVSAWQVSNRPTWIDGLNLLPSSDVEASVLSFSGARPAERDLIDQRVINEVNAQNLGKHPYCVEQDSSNANCDSSSEYLYASGKVPQLSYSSRSFNVTNPNGDDNGNGYTNIEEVLYQMASQVEGRF